MIAAAPFLVTLFFTALEHREELTEAGMGFLRALRASLSDVDELTVAEVMEIGVNAAKHGIDLRNVVLERLQPGGDWHGQMTPLELEQFAAAVEAARSRVAGGRGPLLVP